MVKSGSSCMGLFTNPKIIVSHGDEEISKGRWICNTALTKLECPWIKIENLKALNVIEFIKMCLKILELKIFYRIFINVIALFSFQKWIWNGILNTLSQEK